ncbi:vacuolar protein sorting-associated protein vta1 homolog [Plakobranchus ocellatus]|uniref:Vacuolar protein sorting-associated protein vta1 homolog n=1 Tax=Plakobranchus ocellatus TaxID=259542 RepID=A0AAV4C998_9GAST|nr:vacuolar protein sorting-associated protein vta1 homolog [Plakobranchus ocellatus]
MSAPSLADIPASLKSSIQKYMRIANEHERRDPVISYYCRLYAMQHGMTVDKQSPEARKFLVSLMDYLEKSKQTLADEEAVQNEVCGQAHLENYALKLFLYADNEDRAGRFGKNVIKAFLTSSQLLDVMTTFGELNEDLAKNRQYARWKAFYINKCLQNGETPVAGPLPEDGEEGLSVPVPSGVGFDNVAGPSVPPSNMTFSTDSGLFPTPGAHAPPSTPQDPPRSGSHQAPQSHHYPGGSSHPSSSYQPQPGPSQGSHIAASNDWTPPPNPGGVQLTSQQYQTGIRYCKFASSAMQYEDAQTAIENLTKALKLLTTGVDPK